MAHITNMDEAQEQALQEFTEKHGIESERFKMENHVDFLQKKLKEVQGEEEKKDMETMPQQIQRLEEKVDKLTNLLNHIFGKHVLINSQWRELIEVPKSEGGGE